MIVDEKEKKREEEIEAKQWNRSDKYLNDVEYLHYDFVHSTGLWNLLKTPIAIMNVKGKKNRRSVYLCL